MNRRETMIDCECNRTIKKERESFIGCVAGNRSCKLIGYVAGNMFYGFNKGLQT